jgi:hypothetical protein
VMHKSFEIHATTSGSYAAPAILSPTTTQSKADLYFQEELARFQACASKVEHKSAQPRTNAQQGTSALREFLCKMAAKEEEPDAPGTFPTPQGSFRTRSAGSLRTPHSGSFKIARSGSFRDSSPRSSPLSTRCLSGSPGDSFRFSRCRSWSSGGSTPTCSSPNGSFRGKGGVSAAMRFLHTPANHRSLGSLSATEPPTAAAATTNINSRRAQWGLIFTDAAHLVLGNDPR